jgi:hypothetical protein
VLTAAITEISCVLFIIGSPQSFVLGSGTHALQDAGMTAAHD